MINIQLYSRNDCPLCEEVEDRLNRLNILYDFIDIDEDEILRKKYHVRIPVLVNTKEQEMGWPFTDSELNKFIQQ